MFAWALTGKHASPRSFLLGDGGHYFTACHSTEQNELLLIPSEARSGTVKLSNTTLIPRCPWKGKALGAAKVEWVLQLNRHLSDFQSLKWTAWANPEITEAVSFSKLTELVRASCCQPFWVLGLDTNLAGHVSCSCSRGLYRDGTCFQWCSYCLPILVIFAMKRLRQNWRTGKLFNHAEVVGGFFSPTEVLF